MQSINQNFYDEDRGIHTPTSARRVSVAQPPVGSSTLKSTIYYLSPNDAREQHTAWRGRGYAPRIVAAINAAGQQCISTFNLQIWK